MKPPDETPDYVYNFIKAICPEAPDLYIASFNEEKALIDATELIIQKDKQITTLIKDEADDDTAIRKLALTVLPEKDVNGDTFGVPDIVTIVKTLIRRIAVLERALKIAIETEDYCRSCLYSSDWNCTTTEDECKKIIKQKIIIKAKKEFEKADNKKGLK